MFFCQRIRNSGCYIPECSCNCKVLFKRWGHSRPHTSA